jgi:hypothetical protein
MRLGTSGGWVMIPRDAAPVFDEAGPAGRRVKARDCGKGLAVSNDHEGA